MKKYIFALIMTVLPVFAYAGCNSPVSLSYEGLQTPSDDEFLYETKEQYDMSAQGYTNTGHKNSGAGIGYECDDFNSGSCGVGDIVEMQRGHVFEGRVVNRKQRYQCIVGVFGDDKWVVVDDNICTTDGFGDVEVGECVKNGQNCRTLTKIDCSGYQLSDVNGIEFEGICQSGPKFICKATKCIDGMTAQDGACIISNDDNNKETPNSNMPEIQIDPVVITAPNPNKARCEASGGKWSNGACVCDASKNLKTVGKVCECIDDNYKFDAATKSCKMLDGELERDNCQKAGTDTAYWDGKKCICRDNTKIWQQDRCVENPVITACNAGSETQWNYVMGKCVCIESNKTMDANGRCVETGVAGGTIALEAGSRSKIKEAAASAKGIAAGFEKTVWKNEEGKFNTTRLASDSIAGVVLGTAGGLITSSVIKKSQVKNGFEDISCTVGGQVVAGWDDLFRVGIK